jgi:hypothetical protein
MIWCCMYKWRGSAIILSSIWLGLLVRWGCTQCDVRTRDSALHSFGRSLSLSVRSIELYDALEQ